MRPMAYVILINKFGEFANSAIALRFNMKLNKAGNFAGWLSPEQVDELREGGFAYKIIDYKFA